MIRYNCPICEKPVESSDFLAGLSIRCPNCQSNIDVPRSSAIGEEPREEPRREEPRRVPGRKEPLPLLAPPDKAGPCLFCTDDIETRTAFVRLRNRSIQGYLKCRCCESCYKRVNAWDRLRFWFMGLMFGSLAFSFFCGIPIAAMVGGKDKEPSTPLQTTVAISVIAVPFALFFLTPIALFFVRGWRAGQIMYPATNALLKRLLGTPWWGLGHHVWMVREPPRGEPYLEFKEP
jgi:hypothetical protein